MTDILDFEKTFAKIGQEVQSFVERITDDIPVNESFVPRADVIDSKENFRILLDLPGLTKEEINLSLVDGVLTVKGERKLDTHEGEEIKRRERNAGSFSRSFHVPKEANSAEIGAKFESGVLHITLPKSEVLKDTTSIPID